MPDYKDLTCAVDAMFSQADLYKPTSFWSEATNLIVNELQKHGIERFRSLRNPLDFFVPTYGVPGNGYSSIMVDKLLDAMKSEFNNETKSLQSLEQFLNGKLNALADYRVLLAADIPHKKPHLHLFSESSFGEPIEQFEFDGRKFSRSSLNYLLGLALLKRNINSDEITTVLEIGGGFGTLGEVLSCANIDRLRYIDIDIPPVSFVAQEYLSNVLGRTNVATFLQTRQLASIEISSLPMASVLCSWQIEKLQGQVDLFVNFISFQEMEPDIVKNYLGHVNRLQSRWILLRNMREGKQQKKDENSVGVETPILSEDYRNMLPEYELVDQNVLPFGYRTIDNFHSELLLFKRK